MRLTRKMRRVSRSESFVFVFVFAVLCKCLPDVTKLFSRPELGKCLDLTICPNTLYYAIVTNGTTKPIQSERRGDKPQEPSKLGALVRIGNRYRSTVASANRPNFDNRIRRRLNDHGAVAPERKESKAIGHLMGIVGIVKPSALLGESTTEGIG